MPLRYRGGTGVYFCSFLVGGQRQAREMATVPNVQEAGWSPEPVWNGVENKNFLSPPGFKRRIFQSVTRLSTDYAIPVSCIQ
jgi:hypothetical protein